MFLEQETISMQVEADQAAVVQVLAAALKMVPPAILAAALMAAQPAPDVPLTLQPSRREGESSTSAAPQSELRTISVPEAGRLYFNLSRNASYAAVKRGDIPVIRVGRSLRAVPTILDARLAAAGR